MKLKFLTAVRGILNTVLVLCGLLVFFALYKLLHEAVGFGIRQAGLLIVFSLLFVTRYFIARYIKKQKALHGIQPFYAKLSPDTNNTLRWVSIGIAGMALFFLYIGLSMLYNAQISDYSISLLTDDEREKMAMIAIPLTYVCITMLCFLLPPLVRLSTYMMSKKNRQ